MGYKILMQVRKPLEDLPTSTNGATSSTKASSPVKAATEKEPNEKDEEARLSREEEKQRLIDIGCPDLAAELEQPADAAEQLCKKCKKDPKRNCKECGCTVCGSREDAGKQLFCEECEFSTHMYCLDPPLEEIPDDDWYCPLCKNDESEIVGKGQMVKYGKARAKMPSRQQMCKRDWGRGMATAGRTKTNTSIAKHHFGPIPGIDVGMSWQYRIQVSEVGIHAPPVAGISGTKEKGCNSLVLAGGYEDDKDHGYEFTYTGSGGRDLSGNKRTAEQTFDQSLTKSNAAIALSCNAKFNDKKGNESTDWENVKPIRVCRSYKFSKYSRFAPEDGVRYDGIYKVVKYYPYVGKNGLKVWKFVLRRDDPSPAPWENNAKKFQCEMYNMNHGEASFSQSDDTKSQDGAEIEKEPEEPIGNIDELEGANAWKSIKKCTKRRQFLNLSKNISKDGAEIIKEPEEPTGNIDELGGKNFKIEEVLLPQEVKSENSTVDKENTEVKFKQEKIESENTPNKEGDYKSKSELDDSKTISDDVNPEDKENEKIEMKQEKVDSAKKLTKIRSKQSGKMLDDSENIENSKSQESCKKDEILSTMLAVSKAVRSRKTKQKIREVKVKETPKNKEDEEVKNEQ